MPRLAQDLMQRNVGIIEASASLAELESAFVEAGVSGFPVTQGGRVVGVISLVDVIRRLATKDSDASHLSTFYAEPGHLEHSGDSLRDLATQGGRPVDDLRVEDLMTPSVVAVAPDATLDEVASTLVEHGVHRVLVTDGGSLLGILSALDLVRLIADGTVRVG